MPDSKQPVSLGCGTLILIAVIVSIFSNSNSELKVQLGGMETNVRNLKEQLGGLQTEVRKLTSEVSELKKVIRANMAPKREQGELPKEALD